MLRSVQKKKIATLGRQIERAFIYAEETKSMLDEREASKVGFAVRYLMHARSVVHGLLGEMGED